MDFLKRLTRLILGLFLFSLGIATTLKANIGFAPWDVFHSGLNNTINISFGTATIVSGIIIGIITILFGEKFGLGTILNMFLIGIFLDYILNANLIPQMTSFTSGVILMIIGLFIIAIGSYFYIGSGFGAGPRDSLMVIVKRKTNLPVGICRAGVEMTAALIGWRMGGMIGFGTIISATMIGICVQVVFSLLKFDPTEVKHQTLKETMLTLKSKEEAKFET